ncbi:hypothetical protein PIB30_021879 [Stylosanthes scabra]|uniref:Uncharacterized protein n=1 Tax=Stylosanthes scabra TaxID=79078 RepID=A0ABU6R9E7_9FABA|nr:hypothetical protein [Stylosanthes scabra]
MANNNATLLSLEMKDVEIIKPSKPTPSCILSLSSIDNNPQLDILCHIIYAYQANLDDDPKAQLLSDPSYVIKQGLSEALVYYYPLAGKIITNSGDGRLGIKCNSANDGVPFLEANANCELSSLNYLEGIDVPTAQKLVFDYDNNHSLHHHHDQTSQHPLVFKVTKFLCGGFTIGMGLSHAVCDGFGASQFFRAVAELASGKSEPSVKPVWERERLIGTVLKQPLKFPIDKTSMAVSPFWPSNELSHECFHFNGESIRRLKMELMKESSDDNNGKESFTTLEALGAYVWRSKARAMELSSDGKTLLCIAVGVRHLLDPPLPEGIGGLGAPMVLTDWRQLGLLDEVNFGWKASVNMIPLPWNMFGYVDLALFLPPSNFDPSMKGGVRVYVSLPKASMPKFKEEMEVLKFIKDEESKVVKLET